MMRRFWISASGMPGFFDENDFIRLTSFSGVSRVKEIFIFLKIYFILVSAASLRGRPGGSLLRNSLNHNIYAVFSHQAYIVGEVDGKRDLVFAFLQSGCLD